MTNGQLIILIIAISFITGLTISLAIENYVEKQVKKRILKRDIKRVGRELKHSYKAFREVKI